MKEFRAVHRPTVLRGGGTPRSQRRPTTSSWRILSGVLICALTLSTQLPAVDFLRGDSNSDGTVTTADAIHTLAFLFSGGEPPTCFDALDTNDDGDVDISDPIRTLHYLSKSGMSLAAPFPDTGADPNEDDLDCDAYGGGTSINDPDASISIVESVTADEDDSSIILTIGFSSSHPISALALTFADDDGIISDGAAAGAEFPGIDDGPSFFSAFKQDGVVEIIAVPDLLARTSVSPGEDLTFARVGFCLEPGTTAGEYAITMLSGELVSGCGETGCSEAGRGITPQLVGTTLAVDSTLADGATCVASGELSENSSSGGDGSGPNPNPNPPPPDVSEVDAQYLLRSTSASPGETVDIPLVIRASHEVQGFSVSIDFDEEVLDVLEVNENFIQPGATPFFRADFDNANDTPGNGGVDEGFVVAAGVVDLLGVAPSLPAETDNEVVFIKFRIEEGTQAQATELRFLDGGRVGGTDPGVINLITVFGVSVLPEELNSMLFFDATLNILPDVSAFFLRGDANADGAVDISDPRFTLNYLFVSGEAPNCLDAADANDDGGVDISDPIMTLQALFVDDTELPEPFPSLGKDPTPDDPLVCRGGISDE